MFNSFTLRVRLFAKFAGELCLIEFLQHNRMHVHSLVLDLLSTDRASIFALTPMTDAFVAEQVLTLSTLVGCFHNICADCANEAIVERLFYCVVGA